MLEQTWRWFGPGDRISFGEIKQAGATGIVTALHHIPVGDVWLSDEILARKSLIEESGLTWSVVESVPVHEDIKKHTGKYFEHIENYKQTLRNLGMAGIKTVCYNFMPVLDWSRTNLIYKFSDGSEVTRFEYAIFIAFDLFILKREGAVDSYPREAVDQATAFFSTLSNAQKKDLQDTVLLGLPGSGETFTLDQLKAMLSEYKTIDRAKLKDHLQHFLREIVPVAEEAGIRLAIHPDDPPWSLMGLPRVVSTEEDLNDIIRAVDTPVNGITLCTGSLGAGYFNQVDEMAQKFAHRINFAHIRNVKRDEYLNFNEDYLFNGDVNVFRVMKALVLEEQKRIREGRPDWQIPMRPDHGNQMLGDLGKDNYPGYSLYGRMKNLAELRGLEIGIRSSLEE
ncbi:MAG: mannonate dehydratase [Bacteroidales bacterium]|nr:mannonate dehydratase [Bacteroidales bacterium]